MSMTFASAPVAYETDNLVVLDIHDRLPQHRTKRYKKRSVSNIKRVIYHHSAGNTKPPGIWLPRMAGFITRSKILGGRGWPAIPYQFAVPFDPDLYDKDWPWGEGRYVIYQTQRLDVVSYHTKTQNDIGIGVVFQGNFNANSRPSAAQRLIAPLLWEEILKPAFGLENTDLFCHSMFTKPQCPGPQLENFVHKTRGDYD